MIGRSVRNVLLSILLRRMGSLCTSVKGWHVQQRTEGVVAWTWYHKSSMQRMDVGTPEIPHVGQNTMNLDCDSDEILYGVPRRMQRTSSFAASREIHLLQHYQKHIATILAEPARTASKPQLC